MIRTNDHRRVRDVRGSGHGAVPASSSGCWIVRGEQLVGEDRFSGEERPTGTPSPNITGEGSTASDRGETVLSERDQARYARHIVLPGFGEEAQRKLRGSRVLVVGAGGLGSPVLLYLAAAGIGHLTIIDDDVVDESNLQRQVIHRQTDVGRPKALSAREAVQRLDPQLSAEAMVARLTADNALELCGDHDLVLDCTDNFATRYLASDAAEITGTPLVWGTILQYQGQLSVCWPGRGPMLRDLFPEVPAADSVPSAVVGGTFGPIVGQTGSMMATEAVKVLVGIGTPAVGRLVLLDALGVGTRTLSFAPDPDRAPVTRLGDGDR